MNHDITPEDALRELYEVALKKQANNGGVDFVYKGVEVADIGKSCLYVHVENGEKVSGCIVGHWLNEQQETPLGEIPEGIAQTVLRGLGYTDTDTLQAVRNVQSLQDNGTPWIQAVREIAEGFGVKLEEGN